MRSPPPLIRSPQPRCIALPPRVGIMAMMNAEERDAARAEAHQKRKVLTEYMKHERDPNVGEFENERDFQEKVERLRIYVKPEYDKAVEHYEQQMLDKSTELKVWLGLVVLVVGAGSVLAPWCYCSSSHNQD